MSARLVFDKDDWVITKKLSDQRLRWLQELDAVELTECTAETNGFLFGYSHGEDHLARQTADKPDLRDQPGDRDGLVNLDEQLSILNSANIDIPMPKSWWIGIDDPLPDDLVFPLFVRTRRSSWKRGGEQGKVTNIKQLQGEMELLRRAFGWNEPVIAREWLDIAPAGSWMFGRAPQEVRTWVIDHEPIAWSFHYLHAVPNPTGFPPSDEELSAIKDMAGVIASPFRSRLIVVDFVRLTNGKWVFMGGRARSGRGHRT